MGRVNGKGHIAASLHDLSALPPTEHVSVLTGISSVVADALDVTDVLVCFGVRDRPVLGPLNGWRTVGDRRFGPNADRDESILSQWYRAARNQAGDPAVRALIRTNGTPRALLHSEVADEETWRRSNVDALLAESNIRDRLVGASPLSPEAELLLVAYRRTSQSMFDAADRDALAELAGRLVDVGKTVARAHGFIDAFKPLAPREREVLRLLLLGLSESRAAALLGLTALSFHQYVVAIYRSLGVRSRGELMAHFLAPRTRHAAVMRFAPYLGERDLAILESLTDGLSEKEIAEALNISPRTVHHAIGTIYRKLGVCHRAALLARLLSASAETPHPNPTVAAESLVPRPPPTMGGPISAATPLSHPTKRTSRQARG